MTLCVGKVIVPRRNGRSAITITIAITMLKLKGAKIMKTSLSTLPHLHDAALGPVVGAASRTWFMKSMNTVGYARNYVTGGGGEGGARPNQTRLEALDHSHGRRKLAKIMKTRLTIYQASLKDSAK